MKLYLVDAENIYFPQVKEYFREIVSSYDNGNYRSAMVMLYSTIVCDLLLKLKELSEVFNDAKAEKILKEINAERRKKGNSSWEKNLIDSIREKTELLSDETYAMISHIYDLRNFSAHPAMNDDYELISPSPEITVAYIKKALEGILTKPAVFAQSIVDRLSEDVAAKKDLYRNDFRSFKAFLNKVYFQRMSEKMTTIVFKAFWRFTFVKTGESVFDDNRIVNRKTLAALLDLHYDALCAFIKGNQPYFPVTQESSCLRNVCVLLAHFPQVYKQLDEETKRQIEKADVGDIEILKWFIDGDLKGFLLQYTTQKNAINFNVLKELRIICTEQGVPDLFPQVLISHYAESLSFSAGRQRFDACVEPFLQFFAAKDFVNLIEVVNSNDQLYDYGGQQERNDKILEYALRLLPENFPFENYPNFVFTKPEIEEQIEEDTAIVDYEIEEVDGPLPF